MSFLSKAVSHRKEISVPTFPNSGRVGSSMIRGMQAIPQRGVGELIQLYSRSPWVRLAADTISFRCSSVEWKLLAPARGRSRQRSLSLKKRLNAMPSTERAKMVKELKEEGEFIELEDHPFLSMMRQGVVSEPWLELPGFEVDRLGYITRDLVGEEVLLLARNDLGVPVAWFPIPPHWVQTPTHERPWFEITVRGHRQRIPPEDIAWHKVPNPTDPFGRGTGVAQSLDHEIELDELAASYLVSVLRNRARPDLLIMAPGLEKQQEEMEEKWIGKMSGTLRQGLVHFLGVPNNLNGDQIVIKDLNRSAADMEMSTMRKDERDIIMQVWGVPPSAVGATENSNRAVAFEAARSLRDNAVSPRVESRRRFLQSRFFDSWGNRAPEYGEDQIIVDYDLPPLADREQQLKAASLAPWVPYENEWRDLMGLDPVDGGDERRAVPFNVQLRRPEELDSPPDMEERAVRSAFSEVLAGDPVDEVSRRRGLMGGARAMLSSLAESAGFDVE